MNGIDEISGWINCATVGSAIAPRIRDVTVIPNCAPGELEGEVAQRGDDAPRCPITLRSSLHVAAVHSDESELGSHEEPGEQDEQDDRAQPEVGAN